MLSLSGVTQTVWMQEPVKKAPQRPDHSVLAGPLLAPGDNRPDRWAILTYFQYEDGEDWPGDTDGLWLVPHYPYDAYVEEALSGYILYDGPEGAMAAPMQSLVRQEQAQYTDWLWPDIPSSVGFVPFLPSGPCPGRGKISGAICCTGGRPCRPWRGGMRCI